MGSLNLIAFMFIKIIHHALKWPWVRLRCFVGSDRLLVRIVSLPPGVLCRIQSNANVIILVTPKITQLFV